MEFNKILDTIKQKYIELDLSTSEYEKLEKIYKEDICQAQPQSEELGKAHMNLGITYNCLEKYDESIEEFELAEQTFKSLSNKLQYFYDSIFMIASNYCYKNDYEQAVEYYTQALNGYLMLSGIIDIQVADCYSLLAYAQLNNNNIITNPLFNYNMALKIYKSICGKFSDHVIDCYNNIAKVYEKHGFIKKAKKYIAKSEKLKEKKKKKNIH